MYNIMVEKENGWNLFCVTTKETAKVKTKRAKKLFDNVRVIEDGADFEPFDTEESRTEALLCIYD